MTAAERPITNGPLTRRTALQIGLGAALAGVAGCGLNKPAAPVGTRTSPSSAVVPTTTTPAVAPAQSFSGSFVSAARGGKATGWKIVTPVHSSAQRLRPVIVLHGLGGDHMAAFTDLGLDQLLTDAVQAGMPPVAIVAVDGGRTYYHHRESGEDAGAMVLTELLPMLPDHGLDISRVAFLGWSMGGYGALLLGGRLGAQRTAAIAASSPALWTRSGDAAPGAFDDATDFTANTLFGREGSLSGIPVRVDCGTSDPFYSATRKFVAGLSPAPAGGFPAGGHNDNFWRSVAPAQLAFVASHLN